MLRTELRKTERGYTSFGYDDDSLKHDAFYAHALVQAMDELCSTNKGISAQYILREPQEFIRKRADEIMTSWGFSSD